jgi:hypothetical protein
MLSRRDRVERRALQVAIEELLRERFERVISGRSGRAGRRRCR